MNANHMSNHEFLELCISEFENHEPMQALTNLYRYLNLARQNGIVSWRYSQLLVKVRLFEYAMRRGQLEQQIDLLKKALEQRQL